MTSTDFSYEQFVVVAETEWKFDFGLIPYTQNPNARITKHSIRMELVEWNIAFNEQTKKLEFSCQNVSEGGVKEVHLEMVFYERPGDRRECYKKMAFKRHIFTPSANLMVCKPTNRDIVFTLRILKDRPMFPDFTLESTTLGRIRNNHKLRVGDQVFHVNKQFLSIHSEYFDLLYNDNFNEANKEEVELKHENADPVVFHDFLLVLCVLEALPNSKNVAALLDLANIYQANNVRDKCERHLWMCREMPAEERYLLTLQFGFNELQTSLMNNASFEEAKRMLAVATLALNNR